MIQTIAGLATIAANTESNAHGFISYTINNGLTPVFDLDGVLLDASHRIKIYTDQCVSLGRCEPDQVGQLDLDHYRANTTRANVMQDRSMPFMAAIHILNAKGLPYHVCTARVICPHTLALLEQRGIKPKLYMGRLGQEDTRKDTDLKSWHLSTRFSRQDRSKLILIDDSIGNCKAVSDPAIGAQAVHLPYNPHWSANQLNIRSLV